MSKRIWGNEFRHISPVTRQIVATESDMNLVDCSPNIPPLTIPSRLPMEGVRYEWLINYISPC